jgi:hypothetical protein
VVDGHISCAQRKQERPPFNHHPSLLGDLEGKKCESEHVESTNFAVLQKIMEEVRVWIMAGAKHLANFVSHHRLQF